jgi:hypothetical protein
MRPRPRDAVDADAKMQSISEDKKKKFLNPITDLLANF